MPFDGKKRPKYHTCGMRNARFVLFRDKGNRHIFAVSEADNMGKSQDSGSTKGFDRLINENNIKITSDYEQQETTFRDSATSCRTGAG